MAVKAKKEIAGNYIFNKDKIKAKYGFVPTTVYFNGKDIDMSKNEFIGDAETCELLKKEGFIDA